VLTDDINSIATTKYTIHRKVDEDFGMFIVVTWSTGAQEVVSVDIIQNTNPAVAQEIGTGQMTTLSAGTTTLTGRTFNTYPLNRLCTTFGRLQTSGDLKAVQLKVKRGGNDITDQTQDVEAGQRINLAVEVLPSGTTYTNLQWTIPGTRVANYVVTFVSETQPTSATVTELTNLKITPIVFYWVDGGDGRRVEYTVTMGGKQFRAGATFNVKRATSTFTATSMAEVTVDFGCDNQLLLRYGCSPPNVGVKFTTNVTAPAGFQAGEDQIIQIVDSTRRTRVKLNGTTRVLQGMGVLDTTFPYGQFFDSPSQDFELDDVRVTANDSFTTWVIYKPASEGAIWVPLKKLSWSWSGDALTGGILNSGSHSPNQTGADTTVFPQWTKNVRSLTFQ
jgi:hypothetical protein